MKRSMICVLILLLGTGMTVAQKPQKGKPENDPGAKASGSDGKCTSIDLLTYTFNDQVQCQLPWRIDHREATQVKVAGVNPFLYDVAVEGKSHSYNNNAPDGLISALVPGLQQPENTAKKAAEVAATPMLASTPPGGPVMALDGAGVPDHITNADDAFTRLKDDQAAYAALQAISLDPNLTVADLEPRKQAWRNAHFPKGGDQTIGKITQERVQCWESCRTDAEMAIADPVQLKTLAEMQSALTKAEYQLLPGKMDLLYQQLTERAFTHYSAPLAPEYDADELVIQVKVTPKSSAQSIVGNSTTVYPCTLRVKGGWRLDFSAGVGIGAMPNQEFALVDVDTAMQVVEEQSTYMSVGAMALAHFRYRAAGAVTGGVSTGVMYDDSQRLRYLLGGSVLFGHRQRIVLSGGFAFGKVQLLSKTQSDKATLPTGSELQYVDRFRVGGFFGLSYNFGN